MRPRAGIVAPGGIADALRRFPRHRQRDVMLRELLDATGMARLLVPIPATLASAQVIGKVHNAGYMRLLSAAGSAAAAISRDGFVDTAAIAAKTGIPLGQLRDAGLGTDCQAFAGLWQYCRAVCGAAVAAADAAGRGRCTVAICPQGGRHHARPTKASGFCYVNDCALAALRLSDATGGGNILVCDLDAHHGDGTEETLAFSSRIHCLSLHRHGEGVYPGTGGARTSRAAGPAGGAVANVPLNAGCRDAKWVAALTAAVDSVAAEVSLAGVVIQCGVDGLGADPRRLLNLSHRAYRQGVAHILGLGLPTVVLGGGGYNDAAAACALVHVVDVALGAPAAVPRWVPRRMPSAFAGAELLRRVGIRAGLAVPTTLAPDDNSWEDVADVSRAVRAALESRRAPGRRAPADAARLPPINPAALGLRRAPLASGPEASPEPKPAAARACAAAPLGSTRLHLRGPHALPLQAAAPPGPDDVGPREKRTRSADPASPLSDGSSPRAPLSQSAAGPSQAKRFAFSGTAALTARATPSAVRSPPGPKHVLARARPRVGRAKPRLRARRAAQRASAPLPQVPTGVLRLAPLAGRSSSAADFDLSDDDDDEGEEEEEQGEDNSHDIDVGDAEGGACSRSQGSSGWQASSKHSTPAHPPQGAAGERSFAAGESPGRPPLGGTGSRAATLPHARGLAAHLDAAGSGADTAGDAASSGSEVPASSGVSSGSGDDALGSESTTGASSAGSAGSRTASIGGRSSADECDDGDDEDGSDNDGDEDEDEDDGDGADDRAGSRGICPGAYAAPARGSPAVPGGLASAARLDHPHCHSGQECCLCLAGTKPAARPGRSGRPLERGSVTVTTLGAGGRGAPCPCGKPLCRRECLSGHGGPTLAFVAHTV